MEQVKQYLNREQQRELRQLIDGAAGQGNIEGEHLFQAVLALSWELRGIVGRQQGGVELPLN